MIPDRARGIQLLHCFSQVMAAWGLFWAWTLVIFNPFTEITLVAYGHYFAYSLLVAGGLVIDCLRPNEDKADFVKLDFVRNCGVSFRQTITVLVTLLLFLVAFKDLAISRLFLFSFIPPLFLLLFYSNRVFPGFLARFLFSGQYVQNTILLGFTPEVARVNDWLARQLFYGLKFVGLVTDLPLQTWGDPLLVLGPTADLEKHIRAVDATQVIAVGLPSSAVHMNQLADTCQRIGVRLLIANDFEGMLGRKVTLTQEDGIHFMGFHREPLESPFNRVLKRVLDLVIAVMVVVFVLPWVSLLVWLLQRWQSPGPLFFHQVRTGMQDRDFLIYKFRTMNVAVRDEAVQATVNDPRVFPAGRWLRRLSVDELPQFINVLKGEMSVVGPRPHLREHDELFRRKMNAYSVRGFIKPGITGLAQVRDLRGELRTDRDMVERVESDLYYLENWSFLLDGAIIARTVWKVIFPPRASY